MNNLSYVQSVIVKGFPILRRRQFETIINLLLIRTYLVSIFKSGL